MYSKRKKSGSGDYRDLVNSKKRNNAYKRAQDGAKNDSFIPLSMHHPDFTDKFNMPIPKERQQDYQDWLKMMSTKQGRDITMDKRDYDIQGYFLSGQTPDERGHSTDQFKKPNHPTFSNESMYSNPFLGESGGQWGDNSFTMGKSNQLYWYKDALEHYMKKSEPGVDLKVMSGGGKNKKYKRAQKGIKHTGSATSGSISSKDVPLMNSMGESADYKKKVYAKSGVKNEYDAIFDQVSKEKGVPKEILMALAGGESSFNRDSIGKKVKGGQAMGIMQLMPDTVKSLGITNPFDPYENISGGAQWLKNAYKMSGNWKDAVGIYNAGPDTWRKNKAGVMKQSPKYYESIYNAIDSLSGDNEPLMVPQIPKMVADKTSVNMPGQQTLFPIQRSTLPSINKPLPQQKNEGIRPATEGHQQESTAEIGEWMKLYDNPELASDPQFISTLFSKK
jgi:hypothetical protein